MKLCIIVLALLGAAFAYETYDGYQVIQTMEVPAVVMPILGPMASDPRYDFWTNPAAGRRMLIMTASENVELLKDTLHRMRLNPTVYIEDMAPLIRKEREENEAVRRSETRSSKAAVYDRYMEYDEIMAFMHETIDANPNLVSLMDYGMTTEGRELHGLKISSGSGRKAVWIDCIIHAREWLAAPVCMKVIEEVVADASLNTLVDWYILPVANPDGYAWTWSDYRMWRKTRRPNPGSNCVGTDPNRNFDFLWNTNNNNNECSEDYPGDRAFSEPETRSMANVMDNLGANMAIYIAMHSYGKYLIYPWGHTADPAPNAAELQAAGEEAADVIRTFRGTVYDVGASGSSLYFTYGASDDYAYGVSGTQYSYTFELPGGGTGGFNPPPSAIAPAVEETTPGIYSLVRRAAAAFNKST